MEGAPPPADRLVTLENWRRAPFNVWSFRNVRNLVPTAPIRRGTAPHWALTDDLRDLEGLGFQGAGATDWTVARWLADSHSDGVVVLQGERILWEGYGNGLKADQQHILMSVSKSVTGVLCGILVERGLVDPDLPVARYVPEVAGSAYQDARLRQVLDMRVGVHFVEDYQAKEGAIIRYREASGWKPPSDPGAPGDLRGFLVSLPAEGGHGGAFHYVSPNSDLLGWVLERAAGRSFAELMTEEIWQPMGAEFDAYVTVDRYGAPRSAGGICMTLRDLARFGLMMARQGRADGRPVVPAGWIDDIRHGGDPGAWQRGDSADMFPRGAYRSQWYATGFDSGAFCAIGIHGQYLYVVPEAEIVIAKFSSAPLPIDDAMEQTSFAAFEAIVAGLTT